MFSLFVLYLLSSISSIQAVVDRTHQSNILLVIDVQRCFTNGGSLAVPDADKVLNPIDRLIGLDYFDQVVFTQDWHPADHVSFASNHWLESPYLPNPKLHKGRPQRSNIIHRPAEPFTQIVLAYTPAGHLCGYEDAYEKGRSCPGLDLKAIQSIEFDESASTPMRDVRSFLEPTTNTTYTLVKQMLWPDHCVLKTEGAEIHPRLQAPLSASVLKKGSQSHIDSYSAFADVAHLSRTPITEMIDRTRHAQLFVVGLALDYCVYYSAMDAHLLERFEVTVIEDAAAPITKERAEQAKNDMRRHGIRIIDAHHIPGFDTQTHDDL